MCLFQRHTCKLDRMSASLPSKSLTVDGSFRAYKAHHSGKASHTFSQL